MDTSGNFPLLSDDDPLYEVSAYTQTLKTALDKMPLGQLASARQTTNTGTISGTTTIIMNIPTFTFRAGRKYRISFQSNFYTSDTASTFAIGISTCSVADSSSAITGLTQIVSTSERPNAASEGRSNKTTAYYTAATDTTLQIKAWVLRVVGTGTIIIQADASNPRDLIIEDLGKQY